MTPLSKVGVAGQTTPAPLMDSALPAMVVLAFTLTMRWISAQLAAAAGQLALATWPISQPLAPLTDCERSGALNAGGVGWGPGFGSRSGAIFATMRPAMADKPTVVGCSVPLVNAEPTGMTGMSGPWISVASEAVRIQLSDAQ